jgi:serine/threonine protein kinase
MRARLSRPRSHSFVRTGSGSDRVMKSPPGSGPHIFARAKSCVLRFKLEKETDQMKVCPVCGKEYPNTTTLCSADAAMLQTVGDPLLGQVLAEKYLIEQLIKRGGMGAVYRGKHVLMDKTVAIKVLRPALAVDDEVVKRFSREAKAASRISHPHAVSVTDFGEAENGVVFLVMEYLDGRTLKDVIKSDGPMPLDRAVEIVRQVSGALDAAHGQGVVHRDLKSDNIMLMKHDGDDWAKVLDFGIAKIKQPEGAMDVDLTAPNLVVGTPQYMSPEQCSQTQPLDARSDIYSLGVILFEMLAGRVPFTGESPTVIMMKQVQEPPPSLLAARPELPASVGAVVARALEKNPADRFQKAGDLSDALAHAAMESDESRMAAPAMAAPVTVANAIVPNDDLDEETLVRPRAATTMPPPQPPLYDQRITAAAPVGSMSLAKIIVPSAIVLCVVFGIVFLLTRSPGQTATNQNQNQNGLATDPNSQPVQFSSPATGDSERGIQSAPLASPFGGTITESASPTPNTNANKSTPVMPTSINGNFGSNDNTSERGNKNTNAPRESPQPKPSPVKTETPPPPKASPKPTQKPAGTPDAP